jgi:hypothetical protein
MKYHSPPAKSDRAMTVALPPRTTMTELEDKRSAKF